MVVHCTGCGTTAPVVSHFAAQGRATPPFVTGKLEAEGAAAAAEAVSVQNRQQGRVLCKRHHRLGQIGGALHAAAGLGPLEAALTAGMKHRREELTLLHTAPAACGGGTV
jgi:hypothetical protein